MFCCTKMIKSISKFISHQNINTHLFISLSIRVILILISNVKAFGVSYTDIDYTIFNDAAELLSRGRSPFDRPTYRYTPLISYLMLPNLFIWSQFGKLLFASCDVISGFIMYKMMKKRDQKDCHSINKYHLALQSFCYDNFNQRKLNL